MNNLFKHIELSSLMNVAILSGGFLVFCIWLYRTSFGKNSLVLSQPRRNNLHPAIPFVVLFVYFGLTGLVFLAVCELLKIPADSWQSPFYANCVTSISAVVSILVVGFLVHKSFARRLKGFGLNPKTIFRDFAAALLNFWALWPAIFLVLIATTEFGKFVYGPDYSMETHQELKFISEYHQLPLIISVVFVAVVIAPVIEEVLFRGLLQTLMLSYGYGPWTSIAVCSFFFLLFHANLSHWPALFVLSIGIGYSYERSGSLFRPIFIHALFNSVSIITALLTIKA
jgi:uncharacterized protein